MRRMIRSATFAVLVIAAFANNQQKQTSEAQPYAVPEAYEAYSAILPSEWSYAYSKIILIKSETVTHEMCLSPDEDSNKLLQDAIKDYNRLNQTAWKLQHRIGIDKQVQLVAPAVLSAPFKAAGFTGWEEMRKQFPDSAGWLEFSAVGFNRDKSIAVLYAGHHCGELCGGGHFWTLQKVKGKWVPLRWSGGSCSWMS